MCICFTLVYMYVGPQITPNSSKETRFTYVLISKEVGE